MTEHSEHRRPADVVIVGGGVAALEGLLALRELAGERVRLTLIAPQQSFSYRALSVTEPFAERAAQSYPLREIAESFGARFRPGSVRRVDDVERRVYLRSGDQLAYDTLVLAPGAHTMPPFDDAIVFGEPDAPAAIRDLLDALQQGTVTSVGFVNPTLAGWSLPLYELALMTAARVRAAVPGDARLLLVTPEQRPLEVFGDRPSEIVEALLADAGIELVAGTHGNVRHGELQLPGAGRSEAVDAVVSLPLMRGPGLKGVPAEPVYGFIPVDEHGRVHGLDHVYAAGDATSFPVKQGGLATQQADAVARHIAARLGAPVDPAPFRPVFHGALFTGADAPRRAEYAANLWRPGSKMSGRYLAPYLASLGAPAAGPTPSGFQEVEIPVARIPALSTS